MASKRIIEVRISGDIKSTKEKVEEPKNDIKDEDKVATIFTNVVATQAYAQLKGELTEMAMYGINRHLMLTDDYVSERQLTASLNVINRSISVGATIVAGASVGGPVGAVFGALVGVSTTMFDIFKNLDQQNIRIKQMDKQLEYQRQRVGFSLTSGSIGENK